MNIRPEELGSWGETDVKWTSQRKKGKVGRCGRIYFFDEKEEEEEEGNGETGGTATRSVCF